MSSFEDWARSNKETLLKFGKSRSNAQRELKKVLNDEQFLSAKKWFKQLGKSKSYTAALHELWGDAAVEEDGDHTDVSELVLEHTDQPAVNGQFAVRNSEQPSALREAVEKLHRVDGDATPDIRRSTLDVRSLPDADRSPDVKHSPNVNRTSDVNQTSDARASQSFDIIASLKRTIDAMDANKPLTIYEKLSRIVEK